MVDNLQAYFNAMVIADNIYLASLIKSTPVLTDEVRDEIITKVMEEIKKLDNVKSQNSIEAIFGYLEEIVNTKFKTKNDDEI